MAAGVSPGREVVLETTRLLLRPWRVAEAVIQRELWTELIHEYRHTAESTQTDTPRSQSSRIRSVPVSHRRSACWRSSAGPPVTSSATAAWSTADAARKGNRSWHSNCFAASGVRATRPRPRWRLWTGRDRPGMNVYGPRSGTGTSLLAVCWRRSGSRRPNGLKCTQCTGPPCSPRDGSDTPQNSFHRRPMYRSPTKSKLALHGYRRGDRQMRTFRTAL